jgi:NAD(P)-dependent dehydrogenase (short-subunit alcohol dehydrogenase family)
MDIAGNVALVTGGASGLGEATARHLHAAGAHVVLFDRDAERSKAIVAELGDRASATVGDATTEEDTAAAVAHAGELGPLRILVTCAGGASRNERTVKRDGTPHSLELFRATMDLNVITTFNAVRLAAAAMSQLEPVGDDEERGAIVTTSSVAGFEGQIGQLAYGTAKAAIIGMTLIAARDLAASGIRVNNIAPGTIDTRAWDAAPPEVREPLEAKVPFPRRFGRPEEFAALAEHLVTNRYLNGHVARLDGAIRFDPR